MDASLNGVIMDQLIALFSTEMLDKPLWMWGIFFAVIFSLLILDLGLFNKKDHEIGVKESLRMSAFYVSIGLLFGCWIWYSLGGQKASEYFTGFIVEESLSLDNIFIIAMIFSYMHIPRKYQHRVLFWGILGVVILRGVVIGFGAAIVHEFEWVLYLFAAFLVFTGIKMLFGGDEETNLENNRVLKFMHRHFKVTKELHGHKFIVKEKDPQTGKVVTFITPLLVTLVMIEIADLIFAVDSIPAIFAITTDPYIVFTSNIFAIMGLRTIYFALAAMLNRFEYLKYALSLVLIFIGSKVFIVDFLDMEKFPPSVSLGITLGILGSGVIFSLWKTKPESKN